MLCDVVLCDVLLCEVVLCDVVLCVTLCCVTINRCAYQNIPWTVDMLKFEMFAPG